MTSGGGVGDAHEQRAALRRAYDADAPRRDARVPEPWRCEIVDSLAARVHATRTPRTVLDIGCGTGQLSRRLADAGLDVVGVDLSLRNAARTRARGVTALVGDLTHMPLRPGSFGGALAFNSLLHVPRLELSPTFRGIARLLAPGAPLVVVVWGGITREGPLTEDWLDPPRFFSTLDDDELAALPVPGFERVETRTLHEHASEGVHPQVLTLVRKG